MYYNYYSLNYCVNGVFSYSINLSINNYKLLQIYI